LKTFQFQLDCQVGNELLSTKTGLIIHLSLFRGGTPHFKFLGNPPLIGIPMNFVSPSIAQQNIQHPTHSP